MPTIIRHAQFAAPPEVVWDHLADLGSMTSFVGWGPVPGIVDVRWENDDGFRVAAIRLVTNSDGSRHREEILAAERGKLLADRIFGLGKPGSWLIAEILDTFELSERADGGTTMKRTFDIRPRSALAVPLLAVAAVAFGKAMDRHHAGLVVAFG